MLSDIAVAVGPPNLASHARSYHWNFIVSTVLPTWWRHDRDNDMTTGKRGTTPSEDIDTEIPVLYCTQPRDM